MRHLTFILIAAWLQLAEAQPAKYFDAADAVFKTYVKQGRVDYKTLKKNPELLQKALDLAAHIELSSLDTASRQAFWINAYNLAVIQGVVQAYPIKSPLDVGGFFDKSTYDLGGQKLTLNEIENKKLRAAFPDEARFHFVLVCAGISCPPIISQAYRPQNLEALLQQQTLKALNDPQFLWVKKNNVYVSEIFKWYREDFTREASVVEFINRFRKDKLNPKAKLRYYPYDWTLNQVN